ncbi:MAG: primosomal protein N' [Candidatus Saccharibacteria bacterium]|nr:primosomal protein N' [Candidatus Saccharibacteria bacterium]
MNYYAVIVGKAVGRGASILTYASSLRLEVGSIVEVPLMRGRAPAVVVKKVAQPDFKCREITKILYSKPLPSHLVKVAVWLSEYYLAPLSSVMQMILPTGVLKKRRSNGGGTEQNGVKTEQTEHTPDMVKFQKGTSSIPLNPAQKKALIALQKAPGATKLLFGVTGSGKTNIYLHEALKALSEQKSVVLLVPEIALTGQLVQVFQKIFGEIVTVIHSKQTEVERQKIFDSLLLSDGPRVVIGPRSALFAPLSNLGLIIVDEEHESTYYQENTPKYSAIRAASKIATLVGCPCILGSATPAVEDFYLAGLRGTLVTLSEKAKQTAVKPEIEIVDFKKRDDFARNRYFSNSLLKMLEKNLKEKKQSLIFHNRRGSSPLTICENCGEELMCPNCFLPLTLHVDNYEMHCHTCGYKCAVPTTCPKCGGAGLIYKGFGTKLLENELNRLFPSARVRRFDADSKKGETLDELYSEVRDGGVDILVGTQMLAKGLDLPLLATVGVVQADSGLALPDFAAEERVFQLLTQVIGRVGRGHLAQANVIIQTFQPEHPVLKYAVDEDYLGFSEYLLKQRRKSGFPPALFVAKASITMKTEATVLKKIREAMRALSADKRLVVSPPMPAFHERTIRGYTWEITVRSKSRKALLEALSRLDGNFHIAMDVPSLL